MAFKGVLVCVFVCLVQQSIAGPYRPKPSCGCGYGKGITKVEEIEKISIRPGYSSLKSGYSPSNCLSIEIPSYGGSLAVSSIGPVAPSGIAVATDVALDGDLELSGVLPYLSAVAFEGSFATSSSSPVAYGCGDVVAINEQIGGNIGAASYGLGGSSIGAITEKIGVIGAKPYGSYGSLGCGCKY